MKKELTCFFVGHKWEFLNTPLREDQLYVVKFEEATCKRCGTTDRRLCYITTKKDK